MPFQGKGARKQQDRQEGRQQQRWVYVLQRQASHWGTFRSWNGLYKSICSAMFSAWSVKDYSAFFSTLHHTGTVYTSAGARYRLLAVSTHLEAHVGCPVWMQSNVARHQQLTSQARVPAPTSSHFSAKDWLPTPMMTPHTCEETVELRVSRIGWHAPPFATLPLTFDALVSDNFSFRLSSAASRGAATHQ